MKIKVFLWSLICLLAAGMTPVFAAGSGKTFDVLGEIAVQQGGRVKPFKSFAQEAVLYVTGKKTFAKKGPAELVVQWMAQPEKWNKTPMIPVGYHALRDAFGLMVIDKRLSPEVILGHKPFLEEVRKAAMKKEAKEDLTTLEQKQMELYERAAFFKSIGEGQVPGWIAHPEEPGAGWLPLRALVSEDGRATLAGFFSQVQIDQARMAAREFLANVHDHAAPAEAYQKALQFAQALDALHLSRDIVLDTKLIQTEVHYLGLRPFRLAWMFYFAAAMMTIIFSLFSLGKDRKGVLVENLDKSGITALALVGFAFHTYGFYLRCMISGRPPVTNMYESMIWVSWGVVFFAMILYFIHRAAFFRNSAVLVAGFLLLLTENFPVALNPSISPLVPVLRSNLWLTVHVLTITLSYGAFALAWGMGHGVVFGYALNPDNPEKQRSLSHYLYRTLQIGVVLLAAGTILGGVWANYSWGRFWGWDPKETWALIALLGYLVVLHGRFTGWFGQFGVAVGSVVAFLGIIMAWYGVNFVLAAGLHSYGFGGGGLPLVLSAITLDLLILGSGIFWYKRKKQSNLAAVS